MACEVVLARAAVALLAALALLAAVALAQPVANSVDPPSWLPPVRVPANGSVYQTLHSPKVWSDSCTVSYYGPSAATVSWTNSTSVYLYPGWSALLFLTESYNINDFAVRCALSSPTFIALKPRYQLPSGASGWIALIANATTLGLLSSCSVGASALGGTIVACIPVQGTGSTVEVASWYNISYVSSFAVYLKSSAAGVLYIGSYIDVSKLVWLSGPPPASTGRQPVYQAVFNATGTYASALPQPSDAWRRPGYTLFLYGPAPPSSIRPAGSLTFWYILDAPANVTVRHAYADGSISAETPAPPRSYVFDEKQPAWINFSSGGGWLKVVAPQQGEELRVAAPAGNAIPVTFFMNDYGQGYTHFIVYTPSNRLAWRDEISSATRSAVAYLQPYGNYILALRKPGEERVLGPVTVSQTQYSLTVLPQLQPAPPPSTAVVWYNSSLPGYVVDVSCSSPPCTITLVKKQATQPQLLAAEFTVTSGGATIAPHLFMWSFDGVDDYMVCGLQPGGSGTPFTVYGWPSITLEDYLFVPVVVSSVYKRTSMIGDVWTDYPSTCLVANPSFTVLNLVWRDRTSSGGAKDYAVNLLSAAGKWMHVVRRFTVARELSFWLNGSRLAAYTVPSSEYTVLDWNPDAATYPSYYKRFVLGANVGSSERMTVSYRYARIWSRELSDAEVQAFAAGSTAINATGLRLFIDPSWCSGTTCFNIANTTIQCRMYNGVARIPDNSTWLWLVQGFPGDGKLHFRFFPEGSRATVWCGSNLIDVQLGWSDVAVQVPAGEKCRVAVHVAPQLYVLETASYTCSEAKCRFTWITSDPFLEASVTDAAGSTYVMISGTSLPQQPGGLPGLADLINWLAGSTGLDYLAGPGAVQAFLIALGSVLLLIAFSTAGSWEFGLLAAAAGLVLLPILLGAQPLAVPAGLVIALAALSLMLRKERED